MPEAKANLAEWINEIADSGNCPFTDIVSHWAKKNITAAYLLNLVEGVSADKVDPDKSITRAEAITLVLRAYLCSNDSFEDIIQRSESAVVTIIRKKPNTQGSGTHIGGGYILTNAHVVIDQNNQLSSDPYQIYWCGGGYGEEQQAKYAEGPCVWAKPSSDLAIVKAEVGEANLPTMPKLKLGNPDSIVRGQPVVAIGTPVGLFGSITQGIVSYVGRNRVYEIAPNVYANIPDMLQVDTAINPGNSGGALINRRGQLIGVPSMKFVSTNLEGLAFCIGLRTILTGIMEARDLGEMTKATSADGTGKFVTMSVEDAEFIMKEVRTKKTDYLNDLDAIVNIFHSQGVRLATVHNKNKTAEGGVL